MREVLSLPRHPLLLLLQIRQKLARALERRRLPLDAFVSIRTVVLVKH
jgi:hypothetical protein